MDNETVMDILMIKNMLIKHEGLRLKPYRCPSGKFTIGIGRNLDDNGITIEEAKYLLENDIARVTKELDISFSWFNELNGIRQAAMIDMCFNIGLSRFRNFSRMIWHLEHGEYDQAATEMLASKWADQVGARAVELAKMVRTGESS